MNKEADEKNISNSIDRTWVDGFPGTITVCDADGIIVDLNENASRAFAENGGKALIGRSVFDCHPEPAKSKLKDMMENRQQRIYTIQQGGLRKFVLLAPWFINGEYAGYLDLSIEIPEEMPHFNRDKK